MTEFGQGKIGVNCLTIINDLSLDKVLPPAIMPTETRDTFIAKRQSLYCNSNKGKNMKPYKIYSDSIDPKALNQFFNAMKQEPVVQGALMPDAHAGYSLPIGAVIATKGMIYPAWVGYDIGCGMCALETTFDKQGIVIHKKDIFNKIYHEIPVGPHINRDPVASNLNENNLSEIARVPFNERGGFNALGTLGSGNHFIEIGYDQNDHIWVIIHSGSRGVGHGTAEAYMRLASNSNKAREGHYGLREDSNLGRSYINDLNWMLEFALENRKEMMRRVLNVMSTYSDGIGYWDNLINRNHNHAVMKHGLWIHRKGATHAEEGMYGVIPGNMRDGAFIVIGKGHPDSLYSSSHGAGRILGRKEAKNKLKLKDFQQTMEGVQAKVGDSTLDESPGAYKDINEVIALQADLIEVTHRVLPIINIKG